MYQYTSVDTLIFLHARPWIPGDEIAIFTAVIHKWRSPLRQFARARTIDEYDVTMLVSYIRVTSQINCGDVTILNQKSLSLATTAKSAIDNCFGEIERSGHQIACKKLNNTFITVNNDFRVTRENYWQIASLVTQKSLFTITHALFFICHIYTAGHGWGIYIYIYIFFLAGGGSYIGMYCKADIFLHIL